MSANGSIKVIQLKRGSNCREEKSLFVDTFDENYRKFRPQDLKPHFRSRGDVTQWLKETFEDEVKYFQEHPNCNFVSVQENGKSIGIAFFEVQADRIHIRQMATKVGSQGRGIGKTMLDYIKNFKKGTRKIIADTRKVNSVACQFYAKHGFEVHDSTHDPELSKDYYCGMTYTVPN